MKKISYLIILVLSIIFLPTFVKADECPNFSNYFEIIDQQGNTIDKTYTLKDKIYMRVYFANVYTIVNQSLKFDSGMFRLVEAKTTSHYSVDYSNINMIKINRREASNDRSYIDYIFEVTSLNGNSSIEIINQSGGCSNSELKQGSKLLYTSKIISDNNFLESVSFSTGYLSSFFNEDVSNYKLILPYNTKEINVVASKSDNSSTVSGDTGVVNLTNKNSLVLNVKSQYGSTRTYKFDIEYEKKEEAVQEQESPYLKNITTTNGNINFSSTTYSYNITIPYSTTYLDVDAQPENQNTTFQISGNGNMKVGVNTITIVTNAPSGKNATYTINVTRLKESDSNEIIPSQPNATITNYLSSLIIENYPISFSKEVTNYYVIVKDFSNLKIDAKPETSGASITIKGNENLKNNSVVSVIVTGLNGEAREYRLTIRDSQVSDTTAGNSTENSKDTSNDGSTNNDANTNQNIIGANGANKDTKDSLISNLKHNPLLISGAVILALFIIYQIYSKTRRL